MAWKAATLPGLRGVRRVISSRSAAMVSTRKANHQASTASLRSPSTARPLPTSQASAPTSSITVCAACCRCTMTTLTPVKTADASSSRPWPAMSCPASSASVPAAEASGAAKAAGSRTATARSMPITVPRKPPIISAACDTTAGTSQRWPSRAGSTSPARSRPPSTPESSAVATRASSSGRNTRAADDGADTAFIRP